MKVNDQRTIKINATPDKVFEYIEKLPMKFPTLRLLETRPFLFIRISLVDGLKAGMKTAFDKKYRAEMMMKENEPMKPGSSFGPFTLAVIDKPKKYFFTLNSYFFKGEAGYSIISSKNGAILSLDCISENPNIKERIYWYLIKPFHVVLSHMVLRNIKNGIQTNGELP